MKFILQNLIFSDDESPDDDHELYYRGTTAKQKKGEDGTELLLAPKSKVQFNTYFNGLSYSKWYQYAGVEHVMLHLSMEGTAEVCLCGYSIINGEPVRTELGTYHVSGNARQEICCEYPSNKQTMLAFEIVAESEAIVFAGFYDAEMPVSQLREIELGIATTTYHKEDYIRKNTRNIQRDLFQKYPEQSAHIHMHIVDNGKTLNKNDIPRDAHFSLHPNPNAGGSGGFARGMMECLHHRPNVSYVLLMDDDVRVLPESLFRTYQLLCALKPEYYDYFVGGAMLLMEKKNIQYEDIGCTDSNSLFRGVKPVWNHFLLKDNLLNEQEYKADNLYQAWWYCCIPTQAILKNGFPLPLFIRGDDAEYSMRCHAQIITMNGICIWHLGFQGKYNPVYDTYFYCRNPLVSQATTNIAPEVNMLSALKKRFRINLLRHAYTYAEFALIALEDYMKGAAHIESCNGEHIISKLSKQNYQLKPYEDLSLPEHCLDEDLYQDIPRGIIKKLIYRITYNGHLFIPLWLLKKEPAVISFDGYTPGKMTLRKTIVAAEPAKRMACVWEIDRKKFWNLQKRYYRDLWNYKKNKKVIKESYRKKRDYLTSERFWRSNLNIPLDDKPINGSSLYQDKIS